VSLGPFQNSNPLKLGSFSQHGVEDELDTALIESRFSRRRQDLVTNGCSRPAYVPGLVCQLRFRFCGYRDWKGSGSACVRAAAFTEIRFLSICGAPSGCRDLRCRKPNNSHKHQRQRDTDHSRTPLHWRASATHVGAGAAWRLDDLLWRRIPEIVVATRAALTGSSSLSGEPEIPFELSPPAG